jgi:hypothetical protein
VVLPVCKILSFDLQIPNPSNMQSI